MADKCRLPNEVLLNSKVSVHTVLVSVCAVQTTTENQHPKHQRPIIITVTVAELIGLSFFPFLLPFTFIVTFFTIVFSVVAV